MKTIEKFRCRIMVDSDHDPSDQLGWFRDEPGPGAVDLQAEEFADKFFFRGEERYFVPSESQYCLAKGPFEAQDEEHQKYILQDLKRAIDFYDGDWHYTWVRAEAVVCLIASGRCVSGRDDIYRITLKGDGICGIESDCEASDYREVWQDQVWHLRWMLKELGFSEHDMREAALRGVDVHYGPGGHPDESWHFAKDRLDFSDGPKPVIEPSGRLVLPKRSLKKSGAKPRKRSHP